LTSAPDGDEWSASLPGRCTVGKRAPVPIGWEAGWQNQPGRCGEQRTLLPLSGIEPRPSVYRLSYRGPSRMKRGVGFWLRKLDGVYLCCQKLVSRCGRLSLRIQAVRSAAVVGGERRAERQGGRKRRKLLPIGTIHVNRLPTQCDPTPRNWQHRTNMWNQVSSDVLWSW
jgi:hypothetical protein